MFQENGPWNFLMSCLEEQSISYCYWGCVSTLPTSFFVLSSTYIQKNRFVLVPNLPWGLFGSDLLLLLHFEPFKQLFIYFTTKSHHWIIYSLTVLHKNKFICPFGQRTCDGISWLQFFLEKWGYLDRRLKELPGKRCWAVMQRGLEMEKMIWLQQNDL